MSTIENNINRALHDEKELTDLLYNLKRIKKLRTKRKYIRLIIKLVVDSKKYMKLKKNPRMFFKDSKSKFIKFLEKFYM